MYVNKKVLSVAIFGALMSTSAFAANLSSPTGAVPAYFAKEIRASLATPRTLLTSTTAATQLQWAISYNFSSNEVRYARVQCSDNLKFDAATSVTSSVPATANIGAINGLGTNVLTFSVTSTGANVKAVDVFSVVGDHAITGTGQNVTCSVGMYDQPSQAQAGGTAGLIQNASFSGTYLAFAPSYELVATPTTHTADVEANPSFSEFVFDGDTNTDEAFFANGSLTYRVRDPDGVGGQTATYGINGVQVTLATMLSAATTLLVDGDFTIARSAGAAGYDAAARGRVWAPGGTASALTATRATFAVGTTGFNNSSVDLISATAGSPTGMAIPTAEYVATLRAVPSAAADYDVTDISNVKIGEIVRNGTQLQAPLAQVPAGWISRMVLTNTGSAARPYTIAVMGETGNVIGTSNLTGTVPANGTVVVDLNNVLTSFTAAPRATLNVSVAGSTNQIQGLYQIVNPTSGSISNHAMIRPGTN